MNQETINRFNRIINHPDPAGRVQVVSSIRDGVAILLGMPTIMCEQLLAALERDLKDVTEATKEVKDERIFVMMGDFAAKANKNAILFLKAMLAARPYIVAEYKKLNYNPGIAE